MLCLFPLSTRTENPGGLRAPLADELALIEDVRAKYRSSPFSMRMVQCWQSRGHLQIMLSPMSCRDNHHQRYQDGSVLFREQKGGRRSVGFGDDPNFIAGAGGVGRENPEAVADRKFILALVFLVELTPVAAYMPVEELSRLLAGCCEGV
jgi:hypothetical protein